MNPVQQIDVYRERWRRARDSLRLVDTEAGRFGTGQVHSAAGKIPARLVILPADPEGHLIDFDEEFWAWWSKESRDPHTGDLTLFGTETGSSAHAAYRYRSFTEDKWMRYVAVTHAGALEMGLGWDASYELRRSGEEEFEVFHLLTLVGRIAAALSYYGEVIQRYSPAGPWEVSLGLIGTGGSLLGGFATGWAEAGHYNHDGRQCSHPNVLMHRELTSWPDTNDATEQAYRLGDQIENSWGSRLRRYIAREGPNEGKFDIANYGWR